MDKAFEAELQKAFDICDIDDEGHITAPELEYALGIVKINATRNDVDNILQQLGQPEKITFGQFRDIVIEMSTKDQTEELKDAFRTFDHDKNGHITKDTLRAIVEPILGKDFSEEQLNKIINDADLDGDGVIDIDEFVTFMMG